MPVHINENYLFLKSSYIFAEIAQRVEKYHSDNPHVDIIRMGIGDVTKPLPSAVVREFKNAVDEMS
ncbi:MAG: LL-diaminopimelate aminotransferase, partial [Methanobacterium sp.]